MSIRPSLQSPQSCQFLRCFVLQKLSCSFHGGADRLSDLRSPDPLSHFLMTHSTSALAADDVASFCRTASALPKPQNTVTKTLGSKIYHYCRLHGQL